VQKEHKPHTPFSLLRCTYCSDIQKAVHVMFNTDKTGFHDRRQRARYHDKL